MEGQISGAKLRRLLLLITAALLGLLLVPCASAWAKMPATITFVNGSPPDGAVAATLPSGQVLIAGGEGILGYPASSAELFNPATDTFSKLTGSGESLTEARVGAVAATLPSGQVLIAGGEKSSSSWTTAELFNPATDTFTKLSQSLTEERPRAVAATLPDGEILIAGGANGTSSASSAELFNPATDTFSKLTGPEQSLREARQGAVAATLPNGQVLIAGGNSGSGRLASAELFNPATDTFSKLTGTGQSLSEARQGAVAATLPNGQVLIAGGNSGSGRLASAELFNPATDTFSKLTGPEQSLSEVREDAVAATLPSGQVLIAGGFNRSVTVSSAELFNPATDTFSKLTARMASAEVLPTSAIANEILELGAYSSSGQAPSFSSATPSVCILSEGEIRGTEPSSVYKEVQFVRAGTCTIDASVKASTEYEAAEAQQSFTVTRLAPQVTISGEAGEATNAKVGEIRQFRAYSSSPLDSEAPGLSSATPSVCSLSNPVPGGVTTEPLEVKDVHFNAVGTCTIVARLSETNRVMAAEATKSIPVEAAPATTTSTPPATTIPTPPANPGILPPAASFKLIGHPSVSHKSAAIKLKTSLGGPGTLRWTLTYKLPSGSKGRFGQGSETVTGSANRTITVKPSAAALRALERARKHGHGLSVKAVLTFDPPSGASPVSLERSIVVRLA